MARKFVISYDYYFFNTNLVNLVINNQFDSFHPTQCRNKLGEKGIPTPENRETAELDVLKIKTKISRQKLKFSFLIERIHGRNSLAGWASSHGWWVCVTDLANFLCSSWQNLLHALTSKHIFSGIHQVGLGCLNYIETMIWI